MAALFIHISQCLKNSRICSLRLLDTRGTDINENVPCSKKSSYAANKKDPSRVTLLIHYSALAIKYLNVPFPGTLRVVFSLGLCHIFLVSSRRSRSTWPHHTASPMAKACHTIARGSSGEATWEPVCREAALPNNFPHLLGGKEMSCQSPAPTICHRSSVFNNPSQEDEVCSYSRDVWHIHE